jgi:alkylation response protein AidB-like acyl-CoA dehydrogenase
LTIVPNFFTDNSDLVAAYDRLELSEAVEVLEEDFTDPEGFGSYAEAMDSYRSALELIGDLAGNYIAPHAAEIDREGARLLDGEVIYASGSEEAYRRLAEAGLAGVIVPRRFGGLNFPATVYIMMIEIVSRADASLMTRFGYQDVGEAIAQFGSEDVAGEFLPDYCAGRATGSMVCTEPGAGSDLQSVRLQAKLGDDGVWRLRGVKHFISNGNGQVLLVLARSEPGVRGMFGLSLFACHGGERVKVNRLEEKMGLHGSPTCELYFDDAPARLVGKRRFGLIHAMHIFNHARFSVAAQALGIAEAAYREALAYAHRREQFGRLIHTFPAVADLLAGMRVSIEAGRALLYAGSQWLDLRNKLEVKIERLTQAGRPTEEAKARFAQAAAAVDLLSPAVKYLVCEAANRICYDAQQIHGGMGYMREMPVERLVRDVRITTIYEGTSQVQVGAAYKGTANDVLGPTLAVMASRAYREELAPAVDHLKRLRFLYEEALGLLEHRSATFKEAAAKAVVDMYLALYAGYLLAAQAESDDAKLPIANRYLIRAVGAAEAGLTEIRLGLFDDLPGVENSR